MANENTIILIVTILFVRADGISNDTYTNATIAPPINNTYTTQVTTSLKPEYTHPKGVEIYDPYNTQHKFGISEYTDTEGELFDDDYFYDNKKDDEHEAPTVDDGIEASDDEHEIIHAGVDNLPIFLFEPQNAYVVKNSPAKLNCKAANALQLYLKCNGVRVTRSLQNEFVDPQTGVRVLEIEYNVTHHEVEEYFGDDRFKCDCYAWTGTGQIKSRAAYIQMAYIKKQFSTSPHGTSTAINGHVTLRCRPPASAPVPKISWYHDGVLVEPIDNNIVIEDGQLKILKATIKNAGNYTCVAENIAGKRTSDVATLKVYVDGGWSAWSPWTPCRCGTGKRRTRVCNSPSASSKGAECIGSSVQRTPDCMACNADGPSRWSPWSLCDVECKQSRKRVCLVPGSCTGDGAEVQYADCIGGLCPVLAGGDETLPSGTRKRRDLALYIGICVLVSIVLAVLLIVFFILKKKKRNIYTRSRSDGKSELFAESEKPLAPDLMQHTRLVRPSPYTRGTPPVVSEHYYDIPQLTTSCTSPADQQTTSCISPDSEDYKPYISSGQSASSGMTSSSTYSVATETVTLPSQLADLVKDSAWSISKPLVDGSTNLHLPLAGVTLIMRESIYSKRSKIHLAVLREDRPHLPRGLVQLSPVVKCGPADVTMNKPAILEVPHCANMDKGYWSFSIFAVERGAKSRSRWKKLVDVGHETIDVPVYTHIDPGKAFLVADLLTSFVLVGESLNGKAVKNLCVVIYGAPIDKIDGSDYSIRVYIVDDTPCALLHCDEKERRAGAQRLADDVLFHFRDGGSPLCLAIEDVCPSWRARNGEAYKEIPFERVWTSSTNGICSILTLERRDLRQNLEFSITVHQRNDTTNKNTINLSFNRSKLRIIENPFECKTYPSSNFYEADKLKRRSLHEYERETNDSYWRIPKEIRTMICAALDPPSNGNGADWRAVAAALGIARYPPYWAARISPTDHVLALWEARHRDDRDALRQFVRTLRALDRHDLALLVEQCF